MFKDHSTSDVYSLLFIMSYAVAVMHFELKEKQIWTNKIRGLQIEESQWSDGSGYDIILYITSFQSLHFVL